MLALTLWRPWSWCVSHLDKRVENRDWPMPKRVLGQRVAIHAGKTLSKYAIADLDQEGIEMPPSFPEGVVCTVRFVGLLNGDASCFDVESLADGVSANRVRELADKRAGLWFSGSYGWVMDEVLVLPSPVACRGAQGLWSLPSEVESAVRAQGACP